MTQTNTAWTKVKAFCRRMFFLDKKSTTDSYYIDESPHERNPMNGKPFDDDEDVVRANNGPDDGTVFATDDETTVVEPAPEPVPEPEPEVVAPGPSAEDVAKWTAAIHEIMERDGVSEAQANAGLVAVLLSEPVQAMIRELEAAAATQLEHDVELWTAVIRDLQERFPQWTEQECNDNLVALLEWVAAHPA